MSRKFRGNSLCESSFLIDNERLIKIVVFFLAFFFFSYIWNKDDKRSQSEKNARSKMAEEYLNKYREENEDFFFQSTNTEN
jgi:hypothetical protein